jgi:hypothetical protein
MVPLLVLLGLTIAVCGCGGSSSGGRGGAGGGNGGGGGADSGGRGGGAGSGGSGLVCSPGSTQVCVGPGACAGGQSCNSDGRAWGTCDCGTTGTGGTAGGAGTAGTGGTVAGTGGGSGGGGTTGTGGRGGAGISGSAGTGGGTAGAGGQGGAAGAGASGGNLVANGDFSEGVTHWTLTNQASFTAPTYAASNGQLCVMMTGISSVTLGWPSDLASTFPLSQGASYTFSYQVSTTTPLSGFEAKIDGRYAPYRSQFDVTTDVPTSNPQAFTHTFVAMADTGAGIAFNIMGSAGSTQSFSVCFQYVSLLKN